MSADAMATRMAVLTRALPLRLLLVDDDELEMELMCERLKTAGFEVACAQHGAEALEALDRQWYPVVITDWQMPVMDGIALTKALRNRGTADTYIIMLTMREASVDYEKGYGAGVDDYLSKRVSDAELLARIGAAFNTLALRRSLREMQAALEQSVTIDAQSGAFAPSELQTRLRSEIRRAQRYGRQLSVLTLGVEAEGSDDRVPQTDLLRAVVMATDSVVRAHIDWIGRLETSEGAVFAVVLPETGASEAPLVKDRVRAALLGDARGLRGAGLTFTFGLAALDRDSEAPLEAREMIEVAEQCRRCPGHTSAEQLSAVQRSVACRLAIACRHGYVIESPCSFKGLASAPVEPSEPTVTG